MGLSWGCERQCVHVLTCACVCMWGAQVCWGLTRVCHRVCHCMRHRVQPREPQVSAPGEAGPSEWPPCGRPHSADSPANVLEEAKDTWLQPGAGAERESGGGGSCEVTGQNPGHPPSHQCPGEPPPQPRRAPWAARSPGSAVLGRLRGHKYKPGRARKSRVVMEPRDQNRCPGPFPASLRIFSP